MPRKKRGGGGGGGGGARGGRGGWRGGRGGRGGRGSRWAGGAASFYELDELGTASSSSSGEEEAGAGAERPARGGGVQGARQKLASIKRAHARGNSECVEFIDLDSTEDDVLAAGRSRKHSNPAEPAEPTVPRPRTPENENGIHAAIEDLDTTPSSLPDPNLSMNVIDSIDSENDCMEMAGCENRTPIITIKFKDKSVAKLYKTKIKEFLLKLIKSPDESGSLSDAETDLELDIWPEDVTTEDEGVTEDVQEDNMFFVDTDPNFGESVEVPQYTKLMDLLTDSPETQSVPQRRGPSCFNCDGAHQLRECPLPRNNARIFQKRKAMTRVGRYHVEDDQKFGHLVPGRISGRLRHALGLKRDEIPMHIYRMRILGYPPGWLEEARISHSGINMFDSSGNQVQDPEEEEGQVCEPGSKDKFDIKKILDFPGYNVAASSRYKEEGHHYGLPPMSQNDSKLLMLANLAPNAMKAYKRKKLTLFPSASNNDSLQGGTADMELDDGEESEAEFPTVPPLPDEAPPPPPPPPPQEAPPPPPPPPPQEAPPPPPPPEEPIENEVLSSDDKECKSQSSSGRSSPSLTDLEEHKRKLLEALESGESTPGSPVVGSPSQCSKKAKFNNETVLKTPQDTSKRPSLNVSKDENKTPQTTTRTGLVKHSDYGTPVLNIASSFVKLPSDDKFAKDICDVINFENLPDSTGKYKKMCTLLKKVKTEVTKIQDS